jgi:WD40 repeat protein
VAAVSCDLPELHLRVWDLASKKPARAIKLPAWKEVFTTYTSCLTLSPDGKLLAAIFLGRKSMVALWDATDGRMETTIPVQAYSLAFRPDGKALAMGLMDGSVVMYDLPGKQKHVIRAKKKAEGGYWMGFIPDGKTLVTLADVMGAGNKRGPSSCGKVRVGYWPADSHTAKHPSITLDQYERYGNMMGRAIASDTATVALQTGPRTVNIFDAATGKMRTSVKSPHNIGFICLSRSGGFLAIVNFGSGMDGKNEFSVWDVTRPGPILAPSPGEPEEHAPGWLIMPHPNMPGGGMY